jgi:site-specific recombinase XerC
MLGMVATAPDRLSGLRDRALLLLGFAGAFRRSELVALDVADLEENETGLLVTIRGSKTDQERQGVTIAIARGDIACPVKALREWLDAAGSRPDRSSDRSIRRARCGPRGLLADRSRTSSRPMLGSRVSTPARFPVILCDPAS